MGDGHSFSGLKLELLIRIDDRQNANDGAVAPRPTPRHGNEETALAGDFIEVQGTAEGHPFNQDELNSMLTLAKKGISELVTSQQDALK